MTVGQVSLNTIVAVLIFLTDGHRDNDTGLLAAIMTAARSIDRNCDSGIDLLTVIVTAA